MLKNVLTGLLILVVAVFGFVGYNSYSAKQHSASDEVYGATGQITKPTSSQPDSETTSSTQPTSPSGSETTSTGAPPPQGMKPPSTDSLPPDPPNGAKFGSTGSKYQLYRQGDLTWRLNTETGQTCIIFATDQEWHKPKVYGAGCRGRE